MAHALQDSAAIFSPSVARLAASTARDWSYVDSWLAAKFPGRPVPAFERNPDTLQVLLGLAGLNETADEERDLLARADVSALQELAGQADSGDGGDGERQGIQPRLWKGELLDAVEAHLSKEGKAALDSMAAVAVEARVAYPEPEQLGSHMVILQGNLCELEQTTARVQVLQSHVQREIDDASHLLARLQSQHYKPSPDLARQNLDMQRKVKAMTAQLPDLRDRASALASSVDSSHPTIEDVTREEQEYLAVLARKKELDASLAAFHGLPSDPDMARSELDGLRRQLQGFTSRRDAVFEGLVERESPARRR